MVKSQANFWIKVKTQRDKWKGWVTTNGREEQMREEAHSIQSPKPVQGEQFWGDHSHDKLRPAHPQRAHILLGLSTATERSEQERKRVKEKTILEKLKPAPGKMCTWENKRLRHHKWQRVGHDWVTELNWTEWQCSQVPAESKPKPIYRMANLSWVSDNYTNNSATTTKPIQTTNHRNKTTRTTTSRNISHRL